MSNPALRVFGSPTAETLEKTGGAFVRLVDAVSAEVAPDSDLHWQISGWKLRCDVCGHEQAWEEAPPGWFHDQPYDYCPSCAVERAR